MGNPNWQTPPEFFKALDEEFHFTLDAAASHENHLCRVYSTLEGTFDEEGPLDERDGLSIPWANERVYCNPPYGPPGAIDPWVRKAMQLEADLAVLLLPTSVDTGWFQDLFEAQGEAFGAVTPELAGHKWSGIWWPHLTMLFKRGRLKFNLPKREKPSQPAGGNLLLVFTK